MLREINKENDYLLFEYFRKISKYIPFYFPIDFNIWQKCMFNDTTDDGKALFKDLKTLAFFENNIIKGFIQYGLSTFIFTENGEKNYLKNYGIIRNFHYMKDILSPQEMLDSAFKYFSSIGINEIDAFFHYFGMSCYARHGKLHNSVFYIENLLIKNSFDRIHENIYFSKDIESNYCYNDPEITFEIMDSEPKKFKITFLKNNEQIGYCELAFFQNNISYLYIIEIYKNYRQQGLGYRCMKILFDILSKKNIVKLDLDTIDSNYIAQNLYTKLGFKYKGITRNYCKIMKHAPLHITHD